MDKNSLVHTKWTISTTLEYKHCSRYFWYYGYYIDTISKNAKRVVKYIKSQSRENLMVEQLTLREYIDLFTGKLANKDKKE